MKRNSVLSGIARVPCEQRGKNRVNLWKNACLHHIAVNRPAMDRACVDFAHLWHVASINQFYGQKAQDSPLKVIEDQFCLPGLFSHVHDSRKGRYILFEICVLDQSICIYKTCRLA